MTSQRKFFLLPLGFLNATTTRDGGAPRDPQSFSAPSKSHHTSCNKSDYGLSLGRTPNETKDATRLKTPPRREEERQRPRTLFFDKKRVIGISIGSLYSSYSSCTLFLGSSARTGSQKILNPHGRTPSEQLVFVGSFLGHIQRFLDEAGID